MSNTTSTSDMVIFVKERRVACDGSGGALGHPKTWLDMGQETQVECKYCDQLYRLVPKAMTER